MNLLTLAFRIVTALNGCDPANIPGADSLDIDAGDVAFCQEVALERIGLVAERFPEVAPNGASGLMVPGAFGDPDGIPEDDECAQF